MPFSTSCSPRGRLFFPHRRQGGVERHPCADHARHPPSQCRQVRHRPQGPQGHPRGRRGEVLATAGSNKHHPHDFTVQDEGVGDAVPLSSPKSHDAQTTFPLRQEWAHSPPPRPRRAGRGRGERGHPPLIPVCQLTRARGVANTQTLPPAHRRSKRRSRLIPKWARLSSPPSPMTAGRW